MHLFPERGTSLLALEEDSHSLGTCEAKVESKEEEEGRRTHIPKELERRADSESHANSTWLGGIQAMKQHTSCRRFGLHFFLCARLYRPLKITTTHTAS